MFISLDFLVQKYGLKFTGILHVGAHECEELSAYDQYISRDKVLWIEAMQDKVDFCKNKFPGIFIEQAVISDSVKTVTFHRSNNGQSSSILNFGTHATMYPYVYYVDEFTCETSRLDSILCKYNIPFNFVNLDIQGVELSALKSMDLTSIDYIYTEVNNHFVYENCSLVTDMDEYLNSFGFTRVETYWNTADNHVTNDGWGDAFYIKNTFSNL